MRSEPLRIVTVCSATRGTYGAVRSMRVLVDGLAERGHETSYATWRGRGLGRELRASGASVDELRVRTKIDPLAVARLARILRRRRADIVHTHLSTSSVIGGLAARLAKVPSVATVHGLSGKLSFSFVDHLIAVADAGKTHLVRQGVPEGRISVVHNGIRMPDLSGQNPADARLALGLEGAFPILATSSRMSAMKGIPEALRAIAAVKGEFPALRYVLLGDGDETATMRALARDLGIEEHVRFVGYVEDVWPWLVASHAFLFPSRKEALPMAVIEAMAAGRPVVATRVGGVPELIDERSGTIVAPEDPAALAAAIAGLCSSPVRLSAQGEWARERARAEFSDAVMAARAEAVYGRMLNRVSVPDLVMA